LLLLGLSSGLAWLVAPLGVTTADLWVAEGFTFLSILTNPHFPLAIGLMLQIFLNVLESPQHTRLPMQIGSALGRRWVARILGAASLGLTLAVVQPWPAAIVLVVLAVYLGTLALREGRAPIGPILITGSAATGAAPVMLYDLYVYRTNPALAAWSAQNLTLSLPPWDYALSYGLVFLLALGGTVVAFRRRRSSDLFLLSWVGSVVILLYVPFALQRRFITGLHVPLVLLALAGLERIIWPRIRASRRKLVTGLIIGSTVLTNVFVPLVAVVGVSQGRHPLVMTRDEAAAYTWLHDHTAWTDTVLAPVESGQFVPAWAGNRVVYGHPFETIDAEAKEAEVNQFYGTDATTAERRALLERYGVRYVLLLAEEGDPDPTELGLTMIWSQGSAALYSAGTGP
jgi:hypothetical protein